MKRKKSWSDYYKSNVSIVEQLKAHPSIKLRYFFEQKHPSSDPLNFDPVTTWPLEKQGRRDAWKAIWSGGATAKFPQ